jgi:hypothetical protein
VLKFISGTVFLFLCFTQTALAEECGIVLGNKGTSSPIFKMQNDVRTQINNIGSPWEFIRKTYGPCSFTVYNENNFMGRKARYGTDIHTRIRTGATSSQNKGGWKTRSLVIRPAQDTSCKIVLRAHEQSRRTGLSSLITTARQTFYGPAGHVDITGWSNIESTSGQCTFKIYNDNRFKGRLATVEHVEKAFNLGWRARSLHIALR